MSVYKALAVDFDGTLTDNSRVSPSVSDSLQAARSRGLVLLLVTGRILDELEAVFPTCHDVFDAIVAENGAVLAVGHDVRELAVPVSGTLFDRLRARGVDARRGRVLIACHAADDRAVLDETRAMGLEDQLIHNRGELMVLPPGVTKASGVHAALRELGLNAHNLVSVGDAENDHALLAASELAVAVYNAVPSLKEEADMILPDANGAGIVALLNGPVLHGATIIEPERHQIVIGTEPDGHPVRVGSRGRTLITGGTHSGKSYVAGLLAERLIDAGYIVVVFDAEGDHAQLDRRPSVVTVKVENAATDQTRFASLLGQRLMSAVIDMTSISTPQQQDLVATLLPHLESQRRRRGLPHTIILDEAHLFFAEHAGDLAPLTSDNGGWCFVTYVPAALPDGILRQIDTAIVLPFGVTSEVDPNVIAAAAIGDVDPHTLAEHLQHPSRQRAVLLGRNRPGEMIDIRLHNRSTPHVRHRHKYAEQTLDARHAFRFCEHDGDTSGVVTRRIDEFDRELRGCSVAALRHHSARNDMSRWAIDVLRDGALADALRGAERLVMSDDLHIEVGRAALLDAIESRYLR